jgi:short-subunit dehydrogenase
MKKAIIIGASSGIGKELAKIFPKTNTYWDLQQEELNC